MLVKMAWRNLKRHLRRTLITASAIALGLAMLVASSGISDGSHGQMIQAGIRSMAGHVVVQGVGWQETREQERVVPDTPAVMRQVSTVLPDAVVVPRVFLQGLLTSPTGSAGVALSAVDPVQEMRVNDLHQKMVRGGYLDGSPTGLVLGRTLASTLGVDVGDKVVLMAQRGKEIESRLFRVQGIFRMGIDEIDGFYAQIPLTSAQEMLGLGANVTQVSVHLSSARGMEDAADALHGALSGKPVEVLTWMQALPELHQWIVFDDAGLYVFLLIIAVIVALGIMNTVLMSVLERVREFGVLLAVGTTPLRLAALVMAEATLLGLLSVLLGVGLGLLINWPLTVWGLDYSGLLGTDVMEAGGVALNMHLYSDLSGAKVVVFAGLAMGMTLLSALYPAIKASHLQPIRCLQHH